VSGLHRGGYTASGGWISHVEANCKPPNIDPHNPVALDNILITPNTGEWI
jgi:hypothetical protein